MNNTLTAKEWLDTNLIKDCLLSNKEIQGMDLDGYTTCSEAMELYAKGKTRILEEKIMEFGKLLKNEQIHATNESITIGNKMHNLLSVYSEHFHIENKQ